MGIHGGRQFQADDDDDGGELVTRLAGNVPAAPECVNPEQENATMRQPSEYPTGEGIGPAANRGELILDYYMTKTPTYDGVCEAAADLIADVLAYIECERRVHEGEAQAEGAVSQFSTPAMIVDDAQAALEGLIVDYAHREAAAAEAFRNRGKK